MSSQWLSNHCVCGAKGGNYLEHCELMRCKCGRFYWALQPTKGGPLKLYPHPGWGDRRVQFISKPQSKSSK